MDKAFSIILETGEIKDCRDLGFSSRSEWYCNYYWKHELTEGRIQLLRTQWGKEVGNKCGTCSNISKKLIFHHNNYNCLWKEKLYIDGLFVCNKCHYRIHFARNGSEISTFKDYVIVNNEEDWSFVENLNNLKFERKEEIKKETVESSNLDNIVDYCFRLKSM